MIAVQALLSLGGLMALALYCHHAGVRRWETHVYEWILRRFGWARTGLRWLNSLGDEAVIMTASLALFFLRLPWPIVVAVWVSPFLEQRWKATVGRGRPDAPQELGFPSGDVAISTVFWPALLGGWGYGIVGGVALARIVRQRHWPLDTLGGVCLGTFLRSLGAVAAP